MDKRLIKDGALVGSFLFATFAACGWMEDGLDGNPAGYVGAAICVAWMLIFGYAQWR